MSNEARASVGTVAEADTVTLIVACECNTRYCSYITIEGGSGRHSAVVSSSHEEALRPARRLLSGQAYRTLWEESRTRHLVLQCPDRPRALVEVEGITE